MKTHSSPHEWGTIPGTPWKKFKVVRFWDSGLFSWKILPVTLLVPMECFSYCVPLRDFSAGSTMLVQMSIPPSPFSSSLVLAVYVEKMWFDGKINIWLDQFWTYFHFYQCWTKAKSSLPTRDTYPSVEGYHGFVFTLDKDEPYSHPTTKMAMV